MYAAQIIRIKDVYGRFLWLDKRHYDRIDRTLIPICTATGLRRSYTPAGEADGQNLLHRGNIAEIRQTRIITEDSTL